MRVVVGFSMAVLMKRVYGESQLVSLVEVEAEVIVQEIHQSLDLTR